IGVTIAMLWERHGRYGSDAQVDRVDVPTSIRIGDTRGDGYAV
ncbi:hypothetical protein LCGC14_2714800, partial [marine sediment metagenome]